MNQILHRLMEIRDAARGMTDEEADVLVAHSGPGDDLALAGRFKQAGCADEPTPEPEWGEHTPRGRASSVTNNSDATQQVVLITLESVKRFRVGQAVRGGPAGGDRRPGVGRVIQVNRETGVIVLEPRIEALAMYDDLYVEREPSTFPTKPARPLWVAGHAWEVTTERGRQAVILRDRASLQVFQLGRAVWARCSHEHPVRSGQAEVIELNPKNGCILLEPRIVALTSGDELLVAD